MDSGGDGAAVCADGAVDAALPKEAGKVGKTELVEAWLGLTAAAKLNCEPAEGATGCWELRGAWGGSEIGNVLAAPKPKLKPEVALAGAWLLGRDWNGNVGLGATMLTEAAADDTDPRADNAVPKPYKEENGPSPKLGVRGAARLLPTAGAEMSVLGEGADWEPCRAAGTGGVAGVLELAAGPVWAGLERFMLATAAAARARARASFRAGAPRACEGLSAA